MHTTNRENYNSIKKIAFSPIMLLVSALVCAAGYPLALTAMKVAVGNLIDLLPAWKHETGMLFQLFALIAGTSLLGYLHGRLSNSYVAVIQTRIYRRLIQHISLQADLSGEDGGQITTLITNDVNAINKCILRILQRLLPDVTLFLAAVYTLGQSTDWLLALAIITLCAIQIMVTWVVNNRLNGKRHDFQKELETSNQTAFYGIDNLEAVKAYGCENTMYRNYCKSFEKYNRLNTTINRVTSTLSAGSLIFTFAVMFFITIVCGEMAAVGRISIGTFFAALTMIDSILSPVMRFDNSVKIVFSAKTNTERINRFLSTPEQSLARSKDFDTVVNPIPRSNKIEFQQVSFSYQPDKTVLDEISFTCVSGKCNYILGKNGSGKSTIVKLLLGAQRPQDGKIMVMGQSVDEISPLALSQNIAVLTQDIVVLPTTIWDNLTLHDSRISKEQVYAVCKAVGIHSEIEALPEKYETRLQDNGEPLSIGQRKRIAIARTLLRDVPVYIFDEPSAGLDPDHVRLLKKALGELSHDRIVMIITHDAALMEDDGHVIRIGEMG